MKRTVSLMPFRVKAVESTIQDAEYLHSKVPNWNSTIIDTVLKKVKALNKNYKYVGMSLLMSFPFLFW